MRTSRGVGTLWHAKIHSIVKRLTSPTSIHQPIRSVDKARSLEIRWKDSGRLTLQVTCFLIAIPVIDQPAAVHWPNHKACPVSRKSAADTQSGGTESVAGPLSPNPIWGENKYVTVRKLNCAAGPRRGRECCFYSSLLTDIRGSLPTRLVLLASSKGISNLAHGGADVYWISLFRGNWIKDAATAIPDFDQRREPRYWKLEYTKHFPDDRLMTPDSILVSSARSSLSYASPLRTID